LTHFCRASVSISGPLGNVFSRPGALRRSGFSLLGFFLSLGPLSKLLALLRMEEGAEETSPLSPLQPPVHERTPLATYS